MMFHKYEATKTLAVWRGPGHCQRDLLSAFRHSPEICCRPPHACSTVGVASTSLLCRTKILCRRSLSGCQRGIGGDYGAHQHRWTSTMARIRGFRFRLASCVNLAPVCAKMVPGNVLHNDKGFSWNLLYFRERERSQKLLSSPSRLEQCHCWVWGVGMCPGRR